MELGWKPLFFGAVVHLLLCDPYFTQAFGPFTLNFTRQKIIWWPLEMLYNYVYETHTSREVDICVGN